MVDLYQILLTYLTVLKKVSDHQKQKNIILQSLILSFKKLKKTAISQLTELY